MNVIQSRFCAIVLSAYLTTACSSAAMKTGGAAPVSATAGTSSPPTSAGAATQAGRTASAGTSPTSGSRASTDAGAAVANSAGVAGKQGPAGGSSAPATVAPDNTKNAGGSTGGGAAAGTTGAISKAGSGGASAPPSSTGTPDKSEGCGKAPPSSDTSVMVGSGTGSYILDLPSNYDNNHPYPLVMVWHGAGVTNTAFHDYLNMHQVVGNDAVVVTPECVSGGSMWPNDASYFDAVLEHFSANYCIDKSHVFTTGHSMGGMHTALLGCLRGDKLRGDAVLAAPHSAGQCVKGNMAAMMSVGMSDFVASYMTEFSYWAMYGGCDMNMKNAVDPMSFYKGALDESGMCTDYGGCAPGTPVRTCTFSGGHEIPPWVAGAVWDFFKKL